MNTYKFDIGPVDTDSISFCKKDGSPFSKEELNLLLKELNNISPEFMLWEDDGYYEKCIALKAKNYILWDGNKKTVKGSAFKTSSKEPILKSFMEEIVEYILNDKIDNINDLYIKYIKLAKNPENIEKWATKKTITKPILNCKGYTEQDILDKKLRRNETEIYDAICGIHVQEGDKVYVYPAILSMNITQQPIMRKNRKTGEMENKGMKDVTEIKYGLKLVQNYNNDADIEHLVKRVYDTLNIFKTILDMGNFTNFSLVKNKGLLDAL